MAVKFFQKFKNLSGLKNYGVAQALRRRHGVEISITGLSGYDKPKARGMRLDVLCGIRRLSEQPWDEFGKWLDEEFLKQQK